MLSLELLHDKIRPLSGELIYVAYSGGMDSHVLLHALAQIRQTLPTLKLRAIHVNHKISVNADEWAEHCQRIAADLGVPIQILTLTLPPRLGQSPEALARTARYGALSDRLKSGDALLTAHHLDDQGETVLLQLCRGAGPKGLSAMAEGRPLGKGLLVRPLLDVGRDALRAYAVHHQLHWVDDESNADCDVTRNHLRHRVLPRLMERVPSVHKTLARTARICREHDALLAQYAATDLADAMNAAGGLSCAHLLKWAPARQRYILRLWLTRLQLSLPSEKKLHALQSDMLRARPDRFPLVAWDGVECRRDQGFIYGMTALVNVDATPIDWSLELPCVLPGELGTLQADRQRGQGVWVGPGQSLQIRFRKGGEVFRRQQAVGTRPLKKHWQEQRVVPWERSQIPLLYLADRLVYVPGPGVAEGACAVGEQMGWVIRWEPIKSLKYSD